MSELIYTEEYYLLVYETADAARRGACASRLAGSAMESAAWWSKKLNCHVWYSQPGDVFMVLKEHGKEDRTIYALLKVLHGERVGWIGNYKWIKFKKVST